MNRVLPLVALGVALLLTACSSGGGVSVSLSPASLPMNIGGSETVDVTLSGGTGPVELSVSGLPSDVTGTFSPATIASGAGSSVLTIDAGAGATAGSYEATVTASGGGQQATATLTLVIEGVDVSGTVMGLYGPLTGVSVAVGNKTAATLADGSFALEGIAVPYDLVVYSDTAGHVFEGLTDPEPTVMAVSVLSMGDSPVAEVEGTLWDTLPADSEAVICVEGLTGVATGCETITSGSTFLIDASIDFGTTVDVRVHALVYQVDGDGMPVTYTGYGTAEGTISVGTNPAIDPVEASTPATITVDGTIDPPGTLAIDAIEGASPVSEDFLIPTIRELSPASNSFSYNVPDFGSGTLDLVVMASNGTGEKSSYAWAPDLTEGANPEIEMPAVPVFVSPPPGETGVTGSTEFEVGGTGGAATTIAFVTGDGLTLAVTSASDTITIPDLSSYGLPLPSGTDMGAVAFYSPGIDDVNVAAYAWLGHYAEAVVANQGSGPGVGTAGGFASGQTEFVTD